MTTSSITVVTAGGIGEVVGARNVVTAPYGMLKHVTDLLDPNKFVSKGCSWVDSYGSLPNPTGVSYEESLRRSLDFLAQMIRDDPNDVIGLGYSAGATLWGRLLEAMAEGQYQDLVIKGVIFLAHPERREGDSFGNTGTGWGVGGMWNGGPEEIPTLSFANPKDMICCSPGDSPIRTIADMTAEMSFVDLRSWGSDIANRLLKSRWQQVYYNWLNPISTYRQFTQAAKDVEGYLITGQHVKYDTILMPGMPLSYTAKMAEVLNQSMFG
jgi:hypothetical protein